METYILIAVNLGWKLGRASNDAKKVGSGEGPREKQSIRRLALGPTGSYYPGKRSQSQGAVTSLLKPSAQ